MIKILDLFCGAGGCAVGYHHAFSKHDDVMIVGVDINPQPNYPYHFVQADALEFLCAHWDKFDFIHASPPCQRYSSITKTANTHHAHPDLLPAVRMMLNFIGKPYVIENVPGAPVRNYITLCGTMFGLDVVRHRHFEILPMPLCLVPPCNHYKPVVRHGRRPDLTSQFHGVTGHFIGVDEAREAMGIDWMIGKELAQAIPPAYTEFIGHQIVHHLVKKEAVA